MLFKTKKIARVIFMAAILLLGFCVMAHAYGGGGGGAKEAGDDVIAGGGGSNSGKGEGLDKLTPAQLIELFGTKEMREKLKDQQRQREEILEKAKKKSRELKDELARVKEALREAAIRIKEGDNSVEAENEYISKWREAIHKQYAAKKAEADRLVAEKNAKLAEDGYAPLDSRKEKNIRDFAQREADKTFKANQEKFIDSIMKYGQEAQDEADERDRQILRWTAVKYASMAGTAGLSGLAIIVKAGQVGIAALSAAEASQLLTIGAVLDAGGAGIGAAADSHASGKSVTESFIRGLSATAVQAVAGEVLGKVPESATAARNALVEFVKANGMDQLQSALQAATDLPSSPGTAPSSSAPNFNPPAFNRPYQM